MPGARLHGPADPHGQVIACRPTPGRRENARSTEKSACPGRETRVGAGCTGKRSHYRSWRCKPRSPQSAGDPGKLEPSLTPTSSFPSCRRQVSIGKRRTRRRRSCAKGHRTPATRPPTTATARRRRRSVKRGQSVSGGERHPVLRFQHYFQPPTQPHGPGDVEATVASNGLTGAIDAGGQKVDSAAATARHALQTGGPRQPYRSSAPTGEQMDIE